MKDLAKLGTVMISDRVRSREAARSPAQKLFRAFEALDCTFRHKIKMINYLFSRLYLKLLLYILAAAPPYGARSEAA
jgi:hypothetical protein